MGLIVVLAAVLALIMGARLYLQRQAEQKVRDDEFGQQQDFMLSQLERVARRVALDPKYASADGFTALGLAWSQKKLVLVSSTFHDENGEKLPKPRVSIRAVDARDLIGATILRESYVKTNKTGGKRKEICRVLDLKINVSDPQDPVHMVRFLADEKAVTSVEYVEAFEEIHRWEAVITAMVVQAATEPEVAEKLTEIDLLREQGAMTEEEFIRQKAQLLARQFIERGTPREVKFGGESSPGAKGATE